MRKDNVHYMFIILLAQTIHHIIRGSTVSTEFIFQELHLNLC